MLNTNTLSSSTVFNAEVNIKISINLKNSSVKKCSEFNAGIECEMKYSTGKFNSINFSLIFVKLDSNKF